MSENTTTIAPAPAEAVATALTAHPDGATAPELATATGLPVRDVHTVLRALTDAGTATHTPGTGTGRRKNPARWAPVPPTPETPTTDSDTAPAGTDDAPADATATTAPADGAADDGAQAVPTPPVGPDLRVLIVAAALAAFPTGVTAAALADKTGLRAGIAARVLAAMDEAGAATRNSDNPQKEERWQLGTTDPATVVVIDGPIMCECACGHKHRRATGPGSTPARARSATPGVNRDGGRKLLPGELQKMVLEFIDDNPDVELTAGMISRELSRSSGAIGNAFDKLIEAGAIQLVDADRKTVTALPAPADQTTPEPATTPAPVA